MDFRLTIGKKLAVGFAALMALLLVLSYASLTAISKLGESLEAAVDTTAKKIDRVAALRDSFQEMKSEARLAQVAYTIRELERRAQNNEERDTGAQLSCSSCHAVGAVGDANLKVDAAGARVKARIGELRPMLAEEAEKKALDAVETGAARWLPLNHEFVQLADGGQFDAAHAILRDQMFPIVEAVEKAAASLTAQQRQSLAVSAGEARDSVLRSRWTALVLIGLNLAVGAVVLWLVHHTSAILRNVARNLGQGADQVAIASTQVASAGQSLAQGASEQAAALEETSASAEQVHTTTRKHSEDARAATGFMTQVGQRVCDANRALELMLSSMLAINTASDKIASILKVIDGIAFQTNILALNAAVEAARAGQAGQGFAVVADEVCNLAQRSAAAAKDTAAMIEESIAKSREGSDRLAQVTQAVRSIGESAQQVKSLVDTMDAGSKEQARGIGQISTAVAQMEQVTQKTAASAEESASASEELSAQAGLIRDAARQLRIMVDGSAASDSSSGVTRASWPG